MAFSSRNIHIWLPNYIIKKRTKVDMSSDTQKHIIFAIADHFEPKWNHVTEKKEQERVFTWINNYPQMALSHCDSDGKYPQHTWFYPYDEFADWQMEKLSKLCSCGYGEVELHLHHDNDTAESLFAKIEEAKKIFSSYGALDCHKNMSDNNIYYSFVHGNWSLDNSRKDGRWCGVNNELQVLKETGCYADFTMPSAPSETQSRKINSIYYATDDPHKPKSYDTGVDVAVGREPSGDLMMIEGPLCLNWHKRKFFIFPKIENGEVSADNLPSLERIDLWIAQHIHVVGRPEWIFVKVYTHGAQDKNCAAFFGEGGILDKMYSYLEDRYNDGIRYKLHYTTTREMYNIIKAAEAGEVGNPNTYRDYIFQSISKAKNFDHE
ncbi:MAG: hypothetical protein ACUVWN_02980 [bacterium]